MASGCDQIIIITGRGKQAIEDHFDVSYELEHMLEERRKTDLLKIVRNISDMMHVAYVRQKEALGLGHAVLMARELVGNEPFAVLLADDVIDAEVPCLKQMVNVFDEKQCSVIAAQVVEGRMISSYGVFDAKPAEGFNGRLFEIRNMVEKPKSEEAPVEPGRSSAATSSRPQFSIASPKLPPAPAANSSSPTACACCSSRKKCTPTSTKATATTPATSSAS